MRSDDPPGTGEEPAERPGSDHGVGDASAAGDSGGAPADAGAVGGTSRAGARGGVPVGEEPEDVPGGRIVAPDSHTKESDADTEAGGSERRAPDRSRDG